MIYTSVDALGADTPLGALAALYDRGGNARRRVGFSMGFSVVLRVRASPCGSANEAGGRGAAAF
jgi:hypothetical protein